MIPRVSYTREDIAPHYILHRMVFEDGTIIQSMENRMCGGTPWDFTNEKFLRSGYTGKVKVRHN